MRAMFFRLCCAALLVITGAASVWAADNVYRLGSGDQIRVNVFGEQSLSGEFTVDGSGSVSLPLLGDLPAAGKSIREMEQDIVAALKDGYLVNPQVSIEVMNYRPFYILGEVNSPGRYPYVSGITVTNAVAMAGGYTYRARQGRAAIEREVQHGGVSQFDGSGSTVVMPGDVITIPERFF